jgi:hypothetical protein
LEKSPLTPALASHIVHRMGEGGQPPDRGIQYVNVGNESYLRILRDEYLRRLLKGAGGSGFKLVQGYYGGGKTHFLYCVRDLAWDEGFPTAIVSLSPQECPYDDAVKVYRAVAMNITAPPTTENARPSRGLTDILRDVADDRKNELGDDFKKWISQTALRVAVDSHSLRRAAAEFMRAYAYGDDHKEAVLEAWLRGDPVNKSDVRELGIFEGIEKGNAFTMLRSMCQLLVEYGFPGSVLLFDEVDRNMSFSRHKIQALGDNLRQVIDLCGSALLPGVLFLYAVPPEFLRNVVPDYPALEQRLKSPIPLSERSPQAPIIDLEHLDLDSTTVLVRIGERLLDVFEASEGWQSNRPIQSKNVRSLAQACSDFSFEIGHRRLFVKTWVDLLFRQRRGEERALLGEEMERLLSDGAASLDGSGEAFVDA